MYKFEDFPEGGSSREVRIACPLGNKCNHKSVDECDAYRQQLLEEEHKKKCGPNCEHFRNPAKGIPETARYQGMNPAEFLLKSRGR
jgi:hypothetical protein